MAVMKIHDVFAAVFWVCIAFAVSIGVAVVIDICFGVAYGCSAEAGTGTVVMRIHEPSRLDVGYVSGGRNGDSRTVTSYDPEKWQIIVRYNDGAHDRVRTFDVRPIVWADVETGDRVRMRSRVGISGISYGRYVAGRVE